MDKVERAREAAKRLAKLAEMTTVDCTPLDAYGRANDATFGDLRAVLAALEPLAERAEDVRLEQALRQIEVGTANSLQFFKERLGDRKKPTWHAVNALQDALAAACGTAHRALTREPSNG